MIYQVTNHPPRLVTKAMISLERYMAQSGWEVTSKHRPSGSHQFGAVDFAPRCYPDGSLAERQIDSLRHPRSLKFAKSVARLFPQLMIYLEPNHIHAHDPSVIPSSRLAAMPIPGVEITRQGGWTGPGRRFVPWIKVSV